MFARLSFIWQLLLRSPAIVRHEVGILDGYHTIYLRRLMVGIGVFLFILICLVFFGMKLFIPIYGLAILPFFIWIGTTPRYIAVLVAIKTLDAKNLNITNHGKDVMKDVWLTLGNIYMAIATLCMFSATLDFKRNLLLLPLLVLALSIVLMSDWFWGIKTRFAKKLCYLYAFGIVTFLLILAVPHTFQVKMFGSAFTSKFSISKVERTIVQIENLNMVNEQTANHNSLQPFLDKVANGEVLTDDEKDAIKKIKEDSNEALVPLMIKKASIFGKGLFEKDPPPPPTWKQIGETKTFEGKGVGGDNDEKYDVKTLSYGTDYNTGYLITLEGENA
ncbi:MAG: hypothetical protein PF572_01390, partial [Patescibacteria group bacterium]|nr:hypothetical protein [Patescibacteria group bacterium]